MTQHEEERDARKQQEREKRCKRDHLRARARQVSTLEDLLAYGRVDVWDYVVVTDGSGTKSDTEAGWAAAIIENSTLAKKYVHGAASHGSNVYSEMRAVVDAVQLLMNSGLDYEDAPHHVHIFSDCMYLVDQAAKQSKRKSHEALWSIIDGCWRKGIQLYWHWVPRDTIAIQKFCHHLANASRKSQMMLADAVLAKMGVESLDAIIPSTDTKLRNGPASDETD